MGEETFYQSINTTLYSSTCIVCELNANYPIDTYISIASAQIGCCNDTVYVYLNVTRFCADSYVMHQLNFETVLSNEIHESSFNMRQRFVPTYVLVQILLNNIIFTNVCTPQSPHHVQDQNIFVTKPTQISPHIQSHAHGCAYIYLHKYHDCTAQKYD